MSWIDRGGSSITHAGAGFQATLLEVNPVFPVGVFEFEELPSLKPPINLGSGEIAPVWSGPLVGGGEFDLAELRGNPVVVFTWLPQSERSLEGLDLMQRLYVDYSEDVEFVTVNHFAESEAARLLERRSITIPTVFCTDAFDLATCAAPGVGVSPNASPRNLWGNPIPSTTVLDADGVVVAVFIGPIEYEDELDLLLAQIAGVG